MWSVQGVQSTKDQDPHAGILTSHSHHNEVSNRILIMVSVHSERAQQAAPRTTPTLTGRAATMAATKYSETMLTALCVMAHEGRISTIIRTSTVVALMNRAAIVTPTGH